MLKYLFTAHYADGTTINQDQADDAVTSISGARSMFYSVLKYQEKSPLVAFVLHDVSESSTNKYAVNVQTGEFIINGARFYVHDKDLPLKNMRIVFFRRHSHSMTTGARHLGHEIVYRVGWQANDADGKNHQGVISFY